ncbi:MAG TPA: hypothetical protein VMK53_00345 [Gemmatimonadales bacterium]|nr:hypothetical protein [Gemmatimonadales bacterium]
MMHRPLMVTLIRTLMLSAALAATVVGAAEAQVRGAGQAQDPPRRPAQGERGERELQLLRMIEERFASQVQRELVLNDDQMVQVRRILTASATRLRQLERQERGVQQALRHQLRPGVAAQTDSVVRLLDRMTSLRVEVAQAAGEEIRELASVLSPVQQAQYVLMRDRLRARAQELRMQRGPMSPPGGRD